MRVFLHLRIRVALERQDAFRTFLDSAIPYYQQPGGITMRLLQDENDPTRFIEVAEYATEADYVRDQARVKDDPTMRRLLEEWRQFLEEAPDVEVWFER